MAADEKARVRVQSIDRAVMLLRCFDARQPEIGISDLARRTGLSTSTVHRLLVSMTDNGLVRKTADRRYSLGPLVIQLGRNGGIPTRLLDVALPVARKARNEVDETVGIHELLPTGHRAVVDQVESHQELRRTYTELGVPLPIAHGAPGKAMLAFLPTERREWELSQPIDAATPRTIADPEALREQLTAIRERGWAYSDAERTPGIRAVAAPIFDHTGGVIGALGFSVPTVRMDDSRSDELGARIKAAAWEVSKTLGATPETVSRTLELASAG
ncbi:MAG: IclR family transcriptional regulator [Actinomycetales bacterium]|nr:IclR family transcriptional regulator [Actinomycetales bacterium]